MNKTHHDSGNHPAARRPRGVATNPRALLARNDHPLPRGTAVIARLMPSCGITNAVYQKLTGGSRRTALRELDALVQFGILERQRPWCLLCLGENETRHKCANSQTEHKTAKGNMDCIVPTNQTQHDFNRPNPS
jgi:hypothetical protein